MSDSKKVRILSIDGGGIRGIIPGSILVYIEEQLQQKAGDPNIRLSDYFDLIAGTSTGGILTCAYLVPDDTGRPKLSAQQAVDIYLERGDEIFDISWLHKMRSGAGVLDEKFDAAELEDALKDNFGDTKLNELLKPCLVTSYDIRRRKAHFFTSHDADEPIHNFYVRDVARATSAAPTYFEVARVKSLFGTPYPLVDGGVFANNPSLCAYSEARGMDFTSLGKAKNPRAKDMAIVSIGTGSSEKPYHYKEAKDWGMVQWIKPIIDIMMAGSSETIDYQLRQIYDAVEMPDSYVRIEPQLYNAKSAMDDASVENLNALAEAGKVNVSEHQETLDKVVDMLIENHTQ